MAARTWLGILASVPAGIVIAWGLAEIPEFFDPCVHWGMGSSGELSPTEGGCNGTTGRSETRAEAAGRLLLVQGGLLGVLVLANVGLAKRSLATVGAAIAILLIGTVPLMVGIAGYFTLSSALLFAVAWLGVRSRPRADPHVTAD